MSQIIATPIVIPSVRILRLRWPNLGFTAAMENLILVLGDTYSSVYVPFYNQCRQTPVLNDERLEDGRDPSW